MVRHGVSGFRPAALLVVVGALCAAAGANAEVPATPASVQRSTRFDGMGEDELREEGKLFVQAVKDGDLQTVEKYLAEGMDVEAPMLDDSTRLGYTPLVWSVVHNQLECARVLLAAGADLEVRTSWNTSPLSLTAWPPRHDHAPGSNVAIAELLLDHGADIDGLTDAGWTTLMHASYHREHALARKLIERGAAMETVETRNPHSKDGDSSPPLRDWAGIARERAHPTHRECARDEHSKAKCAAYLELVSLHARYGAALGDGSLHQEL